MISRGLSPSSTSAALEPGSDCVSQRRVSDVRMDRGSQRPTPTVPPTAGTSPPDRTNDNANNAKRPRAAARVDRLPASRGLSSTMGLLFLSWLIESSDIGLPGAVLPSLTQQFALSTAMKSFVAIAANICIVIGIVPSGRLADRFGRPNVLIVRSMAYGILTFATGFVHGITSLITLRIVDCMAMGAVFPISYIY